MAGLVPGANLSAVMPALVAGIHVLLHRVKKDVDGRDKRSHDRGGDLRCARVTARRRAGHDDPGVSETRPRYAAYFFSEVLLLRGSSAGLT